MSDKPRIAFFSSYWSVGQEIAIGGSDYWRCILPASQLYMHGWDVIFGRSVATSPDGTLRIMDPAGNWHDDREIIVWQRWMGRDTADYLLRARAAGQVVINDVDDHYWALPEGHQALDGTDPDLHPNYHREHYRETLKASSLITTSTPYLLRELDGWGPPVQLLKNYVSLESWGPPRLPGDHVGWVGALPWRGADLELLRETVVPWLRERERFFYHGGHMEGRRTAEDALGYDRVSTREACSVEEYPKLWDPLRVALIPIDDTPFGMAKSWAKGLEACARGIPFITSKHAEYDALGAGLTAEDPRGWTMWLDALEDPVIYEREARANRARAEELSIESNWWRWDEVLRYAATLTEAPKAAKPTRHLARDLAAAPDQETERQLQEIPSATTLSERLFMRNYAATVWDGQGDVFENGPLLGGSTRALALGMLANPNRREDAKLWTYDWFSLSEPLDLPAKTFEGLIAQDLLSPDTYHEALGTGSFKPIFCSLHFGRPYWETLRPRVGYLPGHRGEVAKDGAEEFNVRGCRFSLALVDGCKSWYGTKFWLKEIAPALSGNAHVLFQDFGQYTCFWLPMLVDAFADRFRPVAMVDHTYAFQLVAPITDREVEERFPDEPTDLCRGDYDEAFDRLVEAAVDRGDGFAPISLATQRAAAYAYIGESEDARKILDDLLADPQNAPLRHYLMAARRSPTYHPEGDPILL